MWHSLQVGSPGAEPFILRRNLEASVSRPSQPTSILTRKLVSGGGLTVVQSGGPMMGGFTEVEVAIANGEVWTLFSEGNVLIDV